MEQYIVMLVEDDEDDQHLFSFCMQIHYKGNKCLIANNGKEALEILHSLVILPDIIFMDINMPVMDGYTCLEIIKQDKELCSIPVILFSTADREYAEATSLELGAVKFLQKPIELDNFCQLIGEAVSIVFNK